jgi:hypothetical protein
MAKAWGVLNFDFGRDVPLENLKSTHEYTNFLENLTHRYTKTPTFCNCLEIFRANLAPRRQNRPIFQRN